ncbi:MAG: VOC family protein [Novosphingobium sp.]|nr:VOC family protein [Novosphingobium sp.]MCP5401417.1 VOC family protein [Novosphingobium sp.]
MINGAHHVALATADMDRLLHFYRDLLGLPLLSDGRIEPGDSPEFEKVVGLEATRVRVAQLGVGNLRIEMFEYLEPIPDGLAPPRSCDVGLRHIAFDVTDIDDEYERLKAEGVTFLSSPQSIGNHGVRSVYLRDPDGNIVEFQEIFPGSPVDRSHVVGMTAD